MSIRDIIGETNPEVLFADGLDEAIIGVACRANGMYVVAYDRDQCVEIFIKRDGMTYEEASEFFDFNVVGAWVGEHTPVYIQRINGDDF